ncbi:MAG: thioredoxin family protein [Puniceicoccales bacterium]|jgi:thiol:disulfide interchange protein DsbD|nr:thioredoxin family protein [Puniceicoccales bacterium]
MSAQVQPVALSTPCFDRTWAGLRAAFLFFCLALFGASAQRVLANTAGAHTQVSLISDHSTVSPGQSLLLGLRLISEPGWHTYWKEPGETGMPTSIAWARTGNATPADAEGWLWPPPKTLLQEGLRSAVLEGDCVIAIPLVVSGDAREGSTVELIGKVSWLECNDRSCIPRESQVTLSLNVEKSPVKAAAFRDGMLPKTGAGMPGWEEWSLEKQQALLEAGRLVYVDFTARWCATCQVNKRVYTDEKLAAAFRRDKVALLRADWTRKSPDISTELGKYGRAAIPVNVFLARGQAPLLLDELLTASHVLKKLDEATGRAPRTALSSGGHSEGSPALALQLLLGFLGGLALNFMPCVFPVLGLKVMGFAAQAGASRRKTTLHGLAFAGGVLVSFWLLAAVLLALRSGGVQLGWGFQLQEPLFVLVLSVLLLLLALNMVGVFEIGGRVAGIAGSVEGHGFLGSFFSGALATLVATPCSAPFLGVALGAALIVPPVASFLIFTSIAIGLSAPCLLLAVAPTLVRLLPQPGMWMESLKQGLSFPLFGSVLYLLWVLSAQVETGLLTIFLCMVLIAFACWVYGRWGNLNQTSRTRLLAKLISAGIFVSTCRWLYLATAGA